MDDSLFTGATATRTIIRECSPELRFIRRGGVQALQQKWIETTRAGNTFTQCYVWEDVPTVDAR